MRIPLRAWGLQARLCSVACDPPASKTFCVQWPAFSGRSGRTVHCVCNLFHCGWRLEGHSWGGEAGGSPGALGATRPHCARSPVACLRPKLIVFVGPWELQARCARCLRPLVLVLAAGLGAGGRSLGGGLGELARRLATPNQAVHCGQLSVNVQNMLCIMASGALPFQTCYALCLGALLLGWHWIGQQETRTYVELNHRSILKQRQRKTNLTPFLNRMQPASLGDP